MRAKIVDYEFKTQLSVKEVATTFRDGIRSRHRGLMGYAVSKGLEWDFYSPDSESDPFAALDNDKPDFMDWGDLRAEVAWDFGPNDLWADDGRQFRRSGGDLDLGQGVASASPTQARR